MVNMNDSRHLPTKQLVPAICMTLVVVFVLAVAVGGAALLKLWMGSE